MYPASNAFHQAVANGNRQKALLIFPDLDGKNDAMLFFSDEDIDVDKGIDFKDYFSAEEDLAIGQALSNEVSFGIFNDAKLLNNYGFGDFLCTLGVYLGTENYQQSGTVMVTTKYATYVGRDTYPFIYRANTALSPQPSFPVVSILAYDDKVWCFGSSGRYVEYSDVNGANLTGTDKLHRTVTAKSKGWNGKGIYYNKDSRILFIYEGGKRERYEFVPLGWFMAERPKVPDVIQIDLTCYDYMQKFDRDMPTAAELGMTYPATISDLFKKMCAYVGVSYVTATFINSDATILREPADFSNVTMREVLKWIAEAAGANARFNRDGKLELAWLKETNQTYEARNYKEFNPAWYKTKKVSRLYNRDTQDVNEQTVGSGNEGYLIQDNPLLKGVS